MLALSKEALTSNEALAKCVYLGGLGACSPGKNKWVFRLSEIVPNAISG